MTVRLGSSLAESEARLAHLLHYPSDIGIEMHQLRVGPGGPEARLFWVDHLASNELLRYLLQWLIACEEPADPVALSRLLPLPRQRLEHDLTAITAALLNGQAALLVEGWGRVLLVDIADPFRKSVKLTAPDPQQDLFDADLRANVGLLRQRLRDPKLRAVQVPLRRPERGEVALVYIEGRVRPSLVRLVRLWAGSHLGEEAVRRGVHNPASAVFGLIPRFDSTRWPDHAAALVDSGHIIVVTDQVPDVLIAPVSAASWLTSPSDTHLRYPLKRWLAKLRALACWLVLLLPGTLVALLNYHSDMIPTAFLAAVTSIRENAPFGIVFDIIGMELLVEIGREAAWRLPVQVPIGQVLIATIMLFFLLVHGGLIGPLAPTTALLGALISLALPSYGIAYLVRTWRFYLLFGAIAFGFFGMATVLVIMLAYLCMARPWGIPYISPTGSDLTTKETTAARGGRRKGGKRRGKVPALFQ